MGETVKEYVKKMVKMATTDIQRKAYEYILAHGEYFEGVFPRQFCLVER